MNTNHDPVRQINYLRQTLSQNKKPLGFFISAGCPLSIISTSSNLPLIPDVAGLTQYISEELKSKEEGVTNKYDKLITELGKSGNKCPNIEDILSFVRGLKQVSVGASEIRGLSENDLIELEKEICIKVAEKTNVCLPSRNTPYHQLAHWIQLTNRDESPVECFTTNYDLLTEQAFEETGVTYFDGFVGSRQPFFDLRAIEDSLIPKHWTRLWKLHGSINWFFNSKQEVYRATVVDNKESCIIHPSHLKYSESRKMPYLALIDRLNSFLRQPSAVLITNGYSFNDTHLNNTIINALKANPTAMVIGLLFNTYTYKAENKEISFRYEKAFNLAKERFNLSVWAFDEAVIGGQQGCWKVADVEALKNENMGDSIVKIETSKNEADGDENVTAIQFQLQLGDFGKFGNFLQSLIGKEQFNYDNAK